MPIDKYGVYKRTPLPKPQPWKPKRPKRAPKPEWLKTWQKAKQAEHAALGTDAAWKRWENDR